MGGAVIAAQTLMLTFVWVLLCRSGDGQHCGDPGKPAFSKSGSNDFYEVGDVVSYECVNEYLLISPFRSLNESSLSGQRRCLPDGTWSYGNVHCYKMLPVKNFTCDEDWSGWCSLVKAVDSASEVLHVIFSEGRHISAFDAEDCKQGFENIWLNESSAMCRFSVDEISNECPRPLHLWIYTTVRKKIEISVQPYGRNGLCGTPETPANGGLIRLDTTTVQHVCNSGYQLVGNEYRYCIDSFWNGTQVICNKTTDEYQSEKPNGRVCNTTTDERHSEQSSGHESWILNAEYKFVSISAVAIAISILTLLILIGVLCVKSVNRNNRKNQPITERVPSVIYMNTGIGATGPTEPESYAEISVNNANHVSDNIYELTDESSTPQLVEALYAQPTKKSQRNQ